MSAVMGSRLAGQRVVVVNWRDLDHTLAGGAEIYAWQFARGLQEAGARVTFLTARDEGQRRQELREDIDVRRGGGALIFYLYAAWWLLCHRRRLDAVIDAATGIPSFAPLFLLRGTPVLLVVHHVHQAQFGVHLPAPLAVLGRWLERVAMRRVYRDRRTVAVSDSTRTEMRRVLGWTAPIGLLENGAVVPPVELVDADAKDPDAIVVLGRLVAHKRVDVVLGALRDLLDRPSMCDRDPRLDVVGRGPERARLEELAAHLGLSDHVHFHGFVDAAAKDAILARASVHVCASDAEGWGQSVIDAAGWGVPTVARDVPGLRDSIRSGETGWLVAGPGASSDETRRELADGLAHALEISASVGGRRQRATACRAWAAKFDWPQMRAEARAWTEEILQDPELPRPATAVRDHHTTRATRAVNAER